MSQHADEKQSLMGKDAENQDSTSEVSSLNEQEEPSSGSITQAKVVQYIKYSYSLALLMFCVRSITVAIWQETTPISQAAHPWVALTLMWVLILWLGILEGGQGSLVGLQPINPEAYVNTHDFTYRCTKLAYEGNNINRFIVGRQFLVVLIIFCVNLCCIVIEGTTSVPGISDATFEVLLNSGIAVMIITVILGQLSAEVNATECMLDFLNSRSVYVTTWLCLAIEESGLLHSVYLVPKVIRWISSSAQKEEDEDASQTGWSFWTRAIFSLAVVVYVMVAAFAAIWHEETTMYEGLPVTLNIAIFIFLICFLGMLEALQIALFAVVNLPESDLYGYKTALSNYRFSFKGTNFQAFLIGRQICVTMCMFLLARITTTQVDIDALSHLTAAEDPSASTVLGMPLWMQNFFNTGLPGALTTTIVASLMWRIVASVFPIPFMNNALVYPTIQVCLWLEYTGIFSSSWLMAKIVKVAARLNEDDVYLQDHKADKMHRQETISLSDSDSCSDDDTASFLGSSYHSISESTVDSSASLMVV